MGLMDEMRLKKGNNIRNNPLNDLEVKKKQLPITTVRIDGDTHAKLSSLAHLSGDNLLNIIKSMIQDEIESFDEDTKNAFEKIYTYKIEEKLDLIKRKKAAK